VERLLNFLVGTDKLWDATRMRERARQVFIDIYRARESGDPAGIPADELFPQTAENLRAEIKGRADAGEGVSFRNLCVRKADIILVRNYTDNSLDEFTVRISAHAQQVRTRNGAVTAQQDDVTPFEEYWTFGRLAGVWKLKDVEPPAQGPSLVAQENLDQDSTPDQLQWYYKHPRAV
jgi:predicted lipid-binding transport protein (Tim44 family)